MSIQIILLRGHKRSGNHLLTNWLMHLYSSCEHLNNLYDESEISTDFIDGVLRTLVWSPTLQEKDLILVTCENPLSFPPQKVEYFIGKSPVPTYSFHLIRDPLNWMASICAKDRRIKTAEDFRLKYRSRQSDWKNWLDAYWIWRDDEIQVDYNQFVSSWVYRYELAAKFGKFLDQELDAKVLNTLWQHPAVDVASSFDEKAVLGGELQASQMPVLERYKPYAKIFLEEGIPDQILEIAADRWGLTLLADDAGS